MKSKVFEIEDGVLLKYNGTAKKVKVPDGVTGIGEEAFSYSKAESVTLPKSCRFIGRAAFLSCDYLKKVVMNDGLEKIGVLAFGDCHFIKSVIIPDTVTEIGDYAFDSCTALKSVTMSKNIRTLGTCVFNDIKDISVDLPETIEKIDCYNIGAWKSK